MPPQRLAFRSLCRQCLSHTRRHFSSSPAPRQPQPDLPPTPPVTGYARLASRALISLTGADSADFIQGLITQNILDAGHQRPSTNAAFYGAFLNAHGRVLHDAFIYPSPGTGESEPSYLVEVDKDQAKSLVKHLKKFKLRAKLKLRPLDEGELSIWASWSEDNGSMWTKNGAGKEFPISCEDKRAPNLGYRIIANGEFEDRAQLLPGEEVSTPTYQLRRMLHGVPEGQNEIISGSSLPMDSNMDVMGGIDFHKGCYLGQELTIRTHHRGVVRKRILPVQLYDFDDPPLESDVPVYRQDTELPLPPSGASITKLGPGKATSPGKFLSGIGNVGLALCRLEAMTDIAFTGEATRYNPDQEFGLSWEADDDGSRGAGRVKAKAFIPPWTREYIMNGGARHRAPMGEAQRAQEMVDKVEGMAHQYEETRT